MLVTLLGIVTEVSPLQQANAFFPILVTLSAIVTSVNASQLSNAQSPMLLTPFSM